MNLNQITVDVTNLKRSIAFYKTFGLQQVVGNDHYARFICPNGEGTFSLHLNPDMQQPHGVTIYFECEQLDDVVTTLKEQGIAFIQDPQDQPWLWREAYLNDPDGHRICLFYAGKNRINPPWRIK